MKTNLNETQQKIPDITVTTCGMDDGTYSLTLKIEDRHINLSSWSYSHSKGHHAGLDIFDMSRGDIYNLALAIYQVAEQIKEAK